MSALWSVLVLSGLEFGASTLAAQETAKGHEQAIEVPEDKSKDAKGISLQGRDLRQDEASATTASPNPPAAGPRSSMEGAFLKNVLRDQRDIWTSPARLGPRNLVWLVPTAAVTGEMLHRDAYAYQKLTPTVNPGGFSRNLSDAGVLSLSGVAASMYLIGRTQSNDRLREAGLLSFQAGIDSIIVSSALKYSLRRGRPESGNQRGDFFQSGGDSFPSNHAMYAWSVASVIAHEYPGPLTKIGVYSLAGLVSASRVTGRRHFPSDVVIGSALGWAIGRHVYRKHHQSDPGTNIGTIYTTRANEKSTSRGSAYVPLDSWVYGAIDRLAALGYVSSAFSGLRPWTRMECARLVQEAEDADRGHHADVEADRLLRSLRPEFARELGGEAGNAIRLDSVYVRILGIDGQPLRDGFHFGQTIFNDEGRPYGEGVNATLGLSGSAEKGRWVAYFRGEYQHGSGVPALPNSALLAITIADQLPNYPRGNSESVDRLRFMEAYVGTNFSNWQITFGKQALWWSPAVQGAMMFSNNAEPILMVRISRTTPMVLFKPLSLMGPLRTEVFFGQVAGQRYVRTRPDLNTSMLFTAPFRQPFIEGFKLSFKPTANLEVGFSITNMLGGPGFPINTRTLLRGLGTSNTLPGLPGDPGDRRSGFDLKYRVPKLRDWLTFYVDSMTEDEFSPVAYPRKSAMNAGLYLSRLPRWHQIDFRAEGMYTDIPNFSGVGSHYFNSRYLSGYTNGGHIFGHWIGRQGSGFVLSSTYWVDAQKWFQLSTRRQVVSREFIAGGGGLADITLTSHWAFKNRVSLASRIQYEAWSFPVLDSSRQKVFSASLELKFSPHKLWRFQ